MIISGSGGEEIEVTYPNELCFTRGRNAYVKAKYTKNAEKNVDVTLLIGGTSSGGTVSITRKTDAKGAVLFPISSILEHFADIKQSWLLNNVNIKVTASGVGSVQSVIRFAVSGYYDRELTPILAQDKPDNRPMPKKMVIYSAFDFMQYIFVPTTMGTNVQVAHEDGTQIMNFRAASLLFGQPGNKLGAHEDDNHIVVTVSGISGQKKTFNQEIEIDPCTDGAMLWWYDVHSIPHHYRWSVESVAEEMSVDDTYTSLDDDLQPYDQQNKTVTKRYTLHSRIVEKDIYNLCKTILSGRDIMMFDPETNEWERCYIEEGEAVDDGAPMKDLVIEVVKYERSL